jgi:signal peptidase I
MGRPYARAMKKLRPLLLIAGLLAFRSVLADQYVIPSGSMEPTIQVGDHVLVAKAAYDLRVPFTSIPLARLGEARRGDVVVFRDPRTSFPPRHLIKRLVGLPGDRVRVKDGRVAVNGEWLPLRLQEARPGRQTWVERTGAGYHEVQRLPGLGREDDREFRVPPDHYFFLGDNRDNSSDSRDWGFAPRSALEGRALRVLYSVQWDGWVPRLSFARSGLEL